MSKFDELYSKKLQIYTEEMTPAPTAPVAGQQPVASQAPKTAPQQPKQYTDDDLVAMHNLIQTGAKDSTTFQKTYPKFVAMLNSAQQGGTQATPATSATPATPAP